MSHRLHRLLVTRIVRTEPKSPQKEITQRERRLAEEAGFNPDLWSDESIREMMDYLEARKKGEL
jgi:hypothetical protein